MDQYLSWGVMAEGPLRGDKMMCALSCRALRAPNLSGKRWQSRATPTLTRGTGVTEGCVPLCRTALDLIYQVDLVVD
jgi:hypothetical protein